MKEELLHVIARKFLYLKKWIIEFTKYYISKFRKRFRKRKRE